MHFSIAIAAAWAGGNTAVSIPTFYFAYETPKTTLDQS